MTPVRLAARDRRAILLGAAALAITWLAGRGLPGMLRAHRTLEQDLVESTGRLARARALVNDEPVMRAAFSASAGRLVALAPRILGGRTPTEVMATLSALISSAAQKNRVRITRMEPLADSVPGPFRAVAVRVEAQGDIRGIARWLATIEEGQPTVSAVDLSIAAVDPAGSADRPEVLRAELTLTGWSGMQRQAGR